MNFICPDRPQDPFSASGEPDIIPLNRRTVLITSAVDQRVGDDAVGEVNRVLLGQARELIFGHPDDITVIAKSCPGTSLSLPWRSQSSKSRRLPDRSGANHQEIAEGSCSCSKYTKPGGHGAEHEASLRSEIRNSMPLEYDNATPKRALEQADSRRLRNWKEEWRFESVQIRTPLDTKDWLRANTICEAAIQTPYMLTKALESLEGWLGDPIKRVQKKSKGFSRVGTVRVKSRWAVSGPTRRTEYKPSERYDYGDSSRSRSKTIQNKFISKACADIAREFLSVSGYGSFLHAILNQKDETNDEYRAYVHVDWYPYRTYNAVTWHKDTQGYTLFVGLIYMNKDEIQGPDVIANPWPLDERVENERKPCMLPPFIKGRIDEILLENQHAGLMKIRQTGKVPAGGGMVWFIDELIHHRTPQPFVDNKISLAISEKNLGALTAQIDTSEASNWQKFDSTGARQFVRVWVTLEPKWMKPVASKSQQGRFEMRDMRRL